MNAELLQLGSLGFLSGGMRSGASSFCVRSAPAFPADLSGAFRCLVDTEIMRVQGNVSGSLLWTVIERGAEGTTQADHNDWSAVAPNITPQAIKNLVGAVNSQGGTSYTIGAADARSLITVSNTSGVAVSLPQATTGDTSSFSPHFLTTVYNAGGGTATITPSTSTINGGASLALTSGQWATIYSDGTNYTATSVVGTTLTSGSVGSGLLGNASVVSGSIASGQVAAAHLSSGVVIAGAGISVAQSANNITITNTSGGFTLTSGIITSGMLGNASVVSDSIASGQVGIPHLASGLISGLVLSGQVGSGQVAATHISSGTVIAGAGITITANATSITVVNASGGFTLTSGCIVSGMLGNASLVSGSVASGSLSAAHHASGFIVAGAGISVSANASNITITNTSGAFSFSLTSGQVGSGLLGNASVVSGSVASGQVAAAHLSSGTVIAGVGISVSANASNITITNTSGGFTLTSGCIVSGMLGNASVVSGSIASGQVAAAHLSSGVVIAGAGIQVNANAGNITITNTSGAGSALTSGIITSGLLGNASVVSGSVASGSLAAVHHSSGFIVAGAGISVSANANNITITNTSGAGGGASLTSGCIVSGLIGNAAVVSGSVASGQITWAHFASGLPCIIFSGTAPITPTVGEFWLDTSATSALASGQVTSGIIGTAAVNWNNVASGTVQSGGSLNFENYIINGGFAIPGSFAQSVVSSGASAGDGFGASQWKGAISSGGTLRYQQWDKLVSGMISGTDTRYFGSWQIGTSGMKAVVFQPIPATTSQGIANKTVQFQFKGKSNTSGLLIRTGILQTTSGVAASGNAFVSVPNSIVSGWAVGTSGTDPTWASGVALVSPATTITLASGAWGAYLMAAQLLSGGVQYIPAMWANNPVSSGTTIDITEAGLYEGG